MEIYAPRETETGSELFDRHATHASISLRLRIPQGYTNNGTLRICYGWIFLTIFSFFFSSWRVDGAIEGVA